MPAKRQQIIIDITTDAKGAITGIKQVNKGMSKLQKGTKDASKQAGGLTGAFKKLKGSWLAVVSGFAAIGFLIKGLQKSVRAASRLEEATAKFGTVFGKQMRKAERFRDVLVSSYAMSTREAVQFLSSIQDTLVPMGVAADKAADFSFQITKLSGDLGSFNDLPTEQVIRDIQSAIVGNRETVRKYGIVLTETRIAQEAMNLGISDGSRELNNAEKAQVALSLITKDSAAAVGDMARTAGSFANTMKRLSARMEDNAAVAGDRLLPTLAALGSAVADVLTPSEKLRKQRVETATAFYQEADAAEGLIKRYTELAEKTNRTTEENEEFRRVSESLARTLPGAVDGIDKLTGAYILNEKKARAAIRAIKGMKETIIIAEADKAAEQILKLDIQLKNLNTTQGIVGERLGDITQAYNEVRDGTLSNLEAQRKYNLTLLESHGNMGLTRETTIDLSQARDFSLQQIDKLEKRESDLNTQLDTNIATLKDAQTVNYEVGESVQAVITVREDEIETINRGSQAVVDNAAAKVAAAEIEEEALSTREVSLAEYYEWIGEQELATLEKSRETQAALLEDITLTSQQRKAIVQAGEEERAQIRLEYAQQEKKLRDTSLALYKKGFNDLTAMERKSVLDRINYEKQWAEEMHKLGKETLVDLGTGFGQLFAGMVQGSKDAKKNFDDFMKSLAKQVMSKAFQQALMLMFPGAGGLLGGIATGFIGGLFASGGYTGYGGKFQPAGTVHKGEYVVRSEKVTPKTRPMLDAVNFGKRMPSRGARGSYADGGLVNPPVAGNQFIFELNVTGLDAVDWDRLTNDTVLPHMERALNEMNRTIL